MVYDDNASSKVKEDNPLTPKQDNSWMEAIPLRDGCIHGFTKCAICESAPRAIKLRKERDAAQATRSDNTK